MARLPIPGQDDGAWGDILNDFLAVEHNTDGSLKPSGSLVAKADDSAVIHITGSETIEGPKTFQISPLLPSPSLNSHATNKQYVDTSVANISSNLAPVATTGKYTDLTDKPAAGCYVVIAASNAPTAVKNGADYLCSGTNDAQIIQAALDSLTLGGTIVLSQGTFTLSAGIGWDTDSITIKGQGVGATKVVAATNSFDIITIGNRQISGIMRNFNHIEDLTVTMAGGSSTHACIKIDGGGRGTSIKNVQTNEGAFGLQLIDLDRCFFENIDINNVRDAGIFLQTGLENTFGTVTFLNCSINLSDTDSTAMIFSSTAAQTNPNAFDRISLINCLFYATPGITGTTGIALQVGATAMSVISCLFENAMSHVHVLGKSQLTFIGVSFIQNSGQSDTIFLFENENHLITVQDCRMQQAVNAFNGISGWTQLQLIGNNNNQGNLTNIFSGQFGARFGTDTSFAGNGALTSGIDNQRYEWGFFNQLRINNNAGTGKVLTSDPNGNATWQTAPPSGAGGTSSQVQYNDSGSLNGASFLTVDTASNPKNLTTTGTHKVVSDGNNGVLFDGSNLTPARNNWNIKQGSDGTFLFDQGGGMSGRFKLGGTGGTTFYDFTPDYSTSLLKITDTGRITTKQATLDDGNGKAAFPGGVNIGSGIAVPSSATANGTKGDIAFDSSYLYICIATNSWKRTALAAW
jgi:hypothetical protein